MGKVQGWGSNSDFLSLPLLVWHLHPMSKLGKGNCYPNIPGLLYLRQSHCPMNRGWVKGGLLALNHCSYKFTLCNSELRRKKNAGSLHPSVRHCIPWLRAQGISSPIFSVIGTWRRTSIMLTRGRWEGGSVVWHSVTNSLCSYQDLVGLLCKYLFACCILLEKCSDFNTL